MVKYGVLDRRQAVRHWVLVPAFAGSNPAGPAIFLQKIQKSKDIGLATLGTNPAGPAKKTRACSRFLLQYSMIYYIIISKNR